MTERNSFFFQIIKAFLISQTELFYVSFKLSYRKLLLLKKMKISLLKKNMSVERDRKSQLFQHKKIKLLLSFVGKLSIKIFLKIYLYFFLYQKL